MRRFAAFHKKSWAVIDRPYSLEFATVGALYERPRCIPCAKPRFAIPVVLLAALVVGCAAHAPNGRAPKTVGTLAELRNVRPDLQELKVEQGLDQALAPERFSREEECQRDRQARRHRRGDERDLQGEAERSQQVIHTRP